MLPYGKMTPTTDSPFKPRASTTKSVEISYCRVQWANPFEIDTPSVECLGNGQKPAAIAKGE